MRTEGIETTIAIFAQDTGSYRRARMNDMNADGRVEAEPSWASLHEAEFVEDSILIASRCVTRVFLIETASGSSCLSRCLRHRFASPGVSPTYAAASLVCCSFPLRSRISSTWDMRMQVFANTASDSNLFPREMPRQCQDFFVQNLEKLVGDHIQRVESRSSI